MIGISAVRYTAEWYVLSRTKTRNGRCDRGALRLRVPEPIRVPVSASPASLYQNHIGVQMPSVEELPAKDAGPHPLLVFLQSQPKRALSRLYQRPSSCLCIFRFLVYSRLVKVESTDTWGDGCLRFKAAWTAREANCYEYSLAGCFDSCLYDVFLGRARGEKVSIFHCRNSPLFRAQVLTPGRNVPDNTIKHS